MNFFQFLKAEYLCLSEFTYYSIRHLRYFTIFLFLYSPALIYIRRMQLLRYGFCLLQYIDDLLDGDRKTKEDVNAIAKDAIEQVEKMQFKDNRAGVLARAFFSTTKKMKLNQEEFQDHIISLIKVMMFDYKRVNDQIILTREELLAQHQNTFTHSVDLMLMAAKSNIRSKDVPNLINTFGWCSTMRDLQEDYERGLYNVPRGVAKLDMSFEKVKTTQVFKQWVQDEFRQAESFLAASNEELIKVKDQKGFKILMIFWKSMNKFFGKFKTRNSYYFVNV